MTGPQVGIVTESVHGRARILEVRTDRLLRLLEEGQVVVVAITDGKLDFGPWEQIFYGEFDGRRPKRVLVKVIGE
jgi:thiamine phosphate synthase YjbQ (UPF0047 family)